MNKAKKEKSTTETKLKTCQVQVDALIARAQAAAVKLLDVSQVDVDRIVHAMAWAGKAEPLDLARWPRKRPARACSR